ncbi:MAG: MBL fold metallo-hydrolase [Clostridia bacterium]|nr:MBL fold metallo-hydrolase [Clostridia bacterium]
MVKRRTRRSGGKWFIAFLAVLLVCTVILVCVFAERRRALAEETVELWFVDVGQGDAAFIVTEEGNVLIDAGTMEEAPTLYHTIAGYGQKLSCLIITHPHDDHMGGASYILERMDVETVILPSDVSDTAIYQKFLTAVEEENAKILYAAADMSFALGGAELTFLMPYSDTQDENENSAVIRLQYGDVSALFTGDAGAQSERLQLARYGENPGGALDADILKVGHHGSDGSSLLQYLYAVSPEYAVISCGEYNSYGHPDPDVLDRLAEAGVSAVCRTDLEGTVRFVLDGEDITKK